MKEFKMPSSLTIVMIFLFIVLLLTWVVPSSVVKIDENGEQTIYYNSSFARDGSIIRDTGPKPKGLWHLVLAPVEGFISAADVAATVFVSGGALGILSCCGALDAGIHSLLKKYSGNTLIVLLMLVFALMGTIYGSWEELTVYAIAIIPLFVMAGYDVMTGISVCLVGSTIGNMASVVNPYSVGAAVASIGNEDLALGSGIILRIVLFVLMFAAGSLSVLNYAKKVKKDPSLSCVAGVKSPHIHREKGNETVPMTRRRKWSLAVFAVMIIFCVFGYVPWESLTFAGGKTAYDYINSFIPALNGTFLGNIFGTNGFMPFGSWYFNEFSVTWITGAVIIGIINRIPEKVFVREFIKGAADLMSVVLVLSAARGIAIIMGTQQEGMSITFIYWIKSILSGVPVWAFSIAAVLVYMLIGIFLQSTSGVAGITMPIFGSAAVALFSNSPVGASGGQIVLISAFTCGISFISGLYPGATTMGIIEMANVPYGTYLKHTLKLLLPVLATAVIIITASPYIGLA